MCSKIPSNISDVSKLLLEESRRHNIPTINQDDALVIYAIVYTYASITTEKKF